MGITYNCTKCEKDLCFNSKSDRYDTDKVGYIDDIVVLCNECHLKGGNQ